MAIQLDSFRFAILAIGIAAAQASWAQTVDSAATSGEERALLEESSEQAEPKKRERKQRKGGRRTVSLEEMSPADRIRMQRQMGDTDLYGKDGVAYRKSWGFKSGVSQLYTPFYEGWADGRDVKGLFDSFAEDGEPGYTLSSVMFNEAFYKRTGKEFVNYFTLIWVPERYAFTLFQPSSFQPIKDQVREKIVKARKSYAKRDQFETFQDYVAFKFGRDEEIENFVDGFWIEANESEEHLTYFYTSEFLVEKTKKKQSYVRPLIATTTYMIVRNKLLKLDVVKVYESQEDVVRLLEFTNGFREDMHVVNRYGESDH